jgi:uncharacterized membrane protein
MNNENLTRKLKLGVIAAVIIAFVAATFYLVYGFTIIWQGMAAGIIIGILLILVFILLALVLYLWFKMLWLKRDLKKLKKALKKHEVEDLNKESK